MKSSIMKKKSDIKDLEIYKLQHSRNAVPQNFLPFTLIEILTVVSLLAFLMAISIAGYQIAMQKSSETDIKSMIKQIEIAMEAYKAKTGYYIQQADGSEFLIDTPDDNDVDFTDFLPDYQKWVNNGTVAMSTNGTGHKDSYVLVDIYGTPFWFRSPGYHNRTSFDLESAGEDCIFGYNDDGTKDLYYNTKENKIHENINHPDDQADNISNWSE